MNKTLIVAALLSAVAASSLALPASAAAAGHDAQWRKEHARRAEANARLACQNRRIHAKVAAGQMTPAQAARLHKKDSQIRHEERDMAAHNAATSRRPSAER